MNISRFLKLAVVLACLLATLPAMAFQTESTAKPDEVKPATKPEGNVKTKDGKIRFTFQEQDWQDVIEWFAEQAGYSLQPISDWPEGTFNLTDDTEYTVLEALDKLNHALLIRKPDPFTLVRNGKMLVLTKTEDANFPNDLIETVKVENLDKRGYYETIKVVFDLGELNADEMFDELQPMIGKTNREFFAVFPAANQIHVRETGGQLRNIRDLINKTRERMFGEQGEMIVYRLKHQDAETFMLIARPFLKMAEGQNRSDDDSLVITPEPFGDRLYVRGTQKMLTSFEKVAEKIDAPADNTDGDITLDAPYLKSYAVLTDPEHAFNVLGTMLEGRDDVRMDLDTVSGSITVLGRSNDHKRVVETLAAVAEGGAEGFAILPLTNGDPAEIIVVLQNLFPQSGEDATGGPVLMANSELNHIIVRGTPQEVASVKQIVAELDLNSVPIATGPRTRHRVIPMDEREQDQIIPILPDLFQTIGRPNRFNLILPEERKDIRMRLKNPDALNGNSPLDLGPPASPESSSNRAPAPIKSSQLNSKLQHSTLMLAQAAGLHPFMLSSYVAPLQDEVGSTSKESATKQKSQEYQPPPQMPSIPGAPIEAKFTKFGLVLDSDDLDALDDLEDMIMGQLGEESVVQLPTFFFLKHRQADQILGFVETYYGMSDGGGGGGGGGNLMTGMMNNMMGGAGDLLGGLLGGGTSGAGGGILEGEDVRFGVDMPFNAMYVAGATGNDLDEISALIEVLDQPEAPQEISTIGEFRTINIIHRDPTEVKTLVEAQLGDAVDTGQKQQGGGQNNEAAQMMKMMQQMTGGGKKGASSQDLEKEKPKVRLGVDVATRQLLVTGPEHIYNDIYKMVVKLDQESLSTPPAFEILDPGNAAAYKRALKAMFGEKVEIVEADASSNGSATTPGSSGSTPESSAGSNPQQASQEAARSAMIQAIQRAQSQRGGGGATRGGGAPTRGGGGSTRGGGGRGGRGG